MVTVPDSELCNVTGGAIPGRNSIAGTTIYKVPPREAVCNREQFDWMAARIGKGVEAHVVRADAMLCDFPMPGSSIASAPSTAAPSRGAQSFVDTIKFDELSALAGSR